MVFYLDDGTTQCGERFNRKYGSVLYSRTGSRRRIYRRCEWTFNDNERSDVAFVLEMTVSYNFSLEDSVLVPDGMFNFQSFLFNIETIVLISKRSIF